MDTSKKIVKIYLALILLVFFSVNVAAQDDYEIQVYTSETAPKGHTLFELHSNYTLIGNNPWFF